MSNARTSSSKSLTAAGLLAGLAVVACSKSSPAPQGPSNGTADERGAAPENVPAGVSDGAMWTCSIDDYDPQPCKFTKDGDGWRLTKLMGSQRFTGVVAFTGEGFSLVGEFFCPWGECDAPVDATFTTDGSAYTGVVDESQVKLWWDDANAKEYGGAGYGGLTGREQ